MWPFNRGWPLNGGPLNRGSTVVAFSKRSNLLSSIPMQYTGMRRPFEIVCYK
jgi:hypothetical protein